MARSKRQRVEPTDDWQQLQLLTRFPEQLTYELLRPVVLFGHSRLNGPAKREHQSAHSTGRRPASSTRAWPASLRRRTHQSRLPDEMRQAIVALKAEYPPLRPHQFATICEVRFGRRPAARTMKRVLAEAPSPTLSPVATRPTTRSRSRRAAAGHHPAAQ